MNDVEKKAYIKCVSCEKVYYSGVLIDTLGMVRLDKGYDRPGVCPACGDPNTKTQMIDLESATTGSKKDVNLGQSDIMMKTLNSPKYQKKLKSKCPYCGHLKDAAGKCWSCGTDLSGSEKTIEV